MNLGCAAICFAAAVDDPASIPWWDQLDVEGDTDTPRRSNLDSDVRIKNMRPVDVQILCVVSARTKSALQLGEKTKHFLTNRRAERKLTCCWNALTKILVGWVRAGRSSGGLTAM